MLPVKRRLISFAALTLSVGALGLASPAPLRADDDTNLIHNPSFELRDPSQPAVPDGWWQPAATGDPVHSTASSHSGAWHVESPLIGYESGGSCVIANLNWVARQLIPVDPRQSYVLSYWTRTSLFSGTAHNMPIAGFEILDEHESLIGSHAFERGEIDATSWTQVAHPLTPALIAWPAGAAFIRLNFGGAGWDYFQPCEPSRLYATQDFDDLSLVKGDLTVPKTGAGPQRSTPTPLVIVLLVAGIASLTLGICLPRHSELVVTAQQQTTADEIAHSF